MEDQDLFSTLIADEAGNQPYEGKVAVAIVVLNRKELKFQSDGTLAGTALKPMQFSGFWCDFVEGKYQRVAKTLEEAEARAQAKFETYSKQTIWASCAQAQVDAQAFLEAKELSFVPGPSFKKLTSRTVNYYNPEVVKTPPLWAQPEKLDALIYAHAFYHN